MNEAVLEEQGVTLPPMRECHVDLSLDAILPDTYIPSEAHRMEMYKKISLIETQKDLLDITDEFLDRFGALPRQGENLLTISYVRAIFAKGGITRVAERSGGLLLTLGDADLALLSELMGEISGMAADIAGRMVEREINAEDHRELVEEFIKSAGEAS